MAITAQKNALKWIHGGQFIKDQKQLSMKKHPNRKRVLRRIANVMRWHYFGEYWRKKSSPSYALFKARQIYRYMREDANGRYF